MATSAVGIALQRVWRAAVCVGRFVCGWVGAAAADQLSNSRRCRIWTVRRIALCRVYSNLYYLHPGAGKRLLQKRTVKCAIDFDDQPVQTSNVSALQLAPWTVVLRRL